MQALSDKNENQKSINSYLHTLEAVRQGIPVILQSLQNDMSLPDEKYKALACFMTLDVALKGVDIALTELSNALPTEEKQIDWDSRKV